jgi:ribulose kinase
MRKDSFSPDFRVVREKKEPFKKMLRKTKYRVKQASRSPITAVSVALVQIVSAVVLENQILLGVGIAVMCIVAFVDALLLVRLKKLLEDEWL